MGKDPTGSFRFSIAREGPETHAAPGAPPLCSLAPVNSSESSIPQGITGTSAPGFIHRGEMGRAGHPPFAMGGCPLWETPLCSPDPSVGPGEVERTCLLHGVFRFVLVFPRTVWEIQQRSWWLRIVLVFPRMVWEIQQRKPVAADCARFSPHGLGKRAEKPVAAGCARFSPHGLGRRAKAPVAADCDHISTHGAKNPAGEPIKKAVM